MRMLSIYGDPMANIMPTVKSISSRLKPGWYTQGRLCAGCFQPPFAKVGFTICYEAEIPECAATLAEQGKILTPPATFTEQDFGESGIVATHVVLKIKFILFTVALAETRWACYRRAAGPEVQF